jgi:hypothetical protein
MLLSMRNTKIGMNLIRTASFGLEALKTCPSAKSCVIGCFALGGNYLFKTVKDAQERRLQASKQDNFVDVMCQELIKLRVGAVRVHDSGDYYEESYLDKWIEIAKKNPSIIFYSYTKSIDFFKSDVNTWKKILPSNMVITFSYGGKHDNLINRKTDKHALVFQSLEQLLEHGYENTSDYDDNAYKADVKLVGLIAKKSRKKDGWNRVFNDVMGGQV